MKKYNKKYIILFFFIYFIFPIFSFDQKNSLSLNSMQEGTSLQNNNIPNTTSNQNMNAINPFNWQEIQEENNNQALKSQDRFNWYRRKILSEKTFTVYTNITTIIESIHKSINLFKEKINEINALKKDFEDTYLNKISLVNGSFAQINDLLLFLETIEKKYLLLKESHLYINNKNYRKKTDEFSQVFLNLKSMISDINNNIIIFFNFYNTIINSINELQNIENETKNFEENAWKKYQELDELINDQNAQKNFLEVSNAFDNLRNYNFYIRNTFLKFFNQSLLNFSTGSGNILNAIDDLIQKINTLNSQIISFENEIIADKEIQKNKFLEEQNAKKVEEERILMIENKKKLEIEKEKNKLSCYMNILKKAKDYTKSVGNIFSIYMQKVITQITYYYNLFFNKNTNEIAIKKHNALINKNQSTVISEAVSSLPPAQENVVQIIPFNAQINQQERNVPLTVLPEVVVNQVIQTQTEDVFNKQIPNIILKEKKQTGSASYPNRLAPHSISLQNFATEQQNNDIAIRASEEITGKEESTFGENKEAIAKDSFQYKTLEKNNEESKDLLNPLVDLSSIQKEKAPSSSAIRAGTADQKEILAFDPGAATSKANPHSNQNNRHHNKENLNQTNNASNNDNQNGSTNSIKRSLVRTKKASKRKKATPKKTNHHQKT